MIYNIYHLTILSVMNKSAIDYGKLSEAINDKADRDYMNCDYIPVSDSEFEIADAENVKLTGNQTISGLKKFNHSGTYVQTNDWAVGETPPFDIYNFYRFMDRKGEDLGGMTFASLPDRTFFAFGYETFGDYYNFGVTKWNNGTIETFAPDPNNTSTTNNIATTRWIRNHTSMPSGKYIDLSIGASGTLYTAPADGWVYAYGTPSGSFGQGYLTNITSGMAIMGTGADSSYINNPIAPLPLKKNETFTLTYARWSPTRLRFVYAEIDSY